MPGFRWSKAWYVVLFLLFVNLAAAVAVEKHQSVDFAVVHFFDVGQGDAVYIRSPQGNDVLIDGGPDSTVLSKLGRKMPFTDRKLELVALTHPHADHVAGLVEVLKRFEVERFLISDIEYETETYKALLALLAEKETEIIRPALGQRIVVDDAVVLDVLFPFVGSFAGQPKDVNNVSTILRLSYGESNVLFTGDAGRNIEHLLLRAGLSVDAEILKVGHQGSRTSSGEGFIRRVAPAYGVILVGENNYGHPHEEVLGVLAENNVETLRTDEKGDISFQIYPDKVLKEPR